MGRKAKQQDELRKRRNVETHSTRSNNEPFSTSRWVEEVKYRWIIELTIKHSKNVPVIVDNILYYELREKEGRNWPDLRHVMDDPSENQIFSKVTSSSPLQWNTYPLTRMIYKEGKKRWNWPNSWHIAGNYQDDWWNRYCQASTADVTTPQWHIFMRLSVIGRSSWTPVRSLDWIRVTVVKKRKSKTYGIDRNVWISEFGDS